MFLKCCPPSCYFKLDPLEDPNFQFLRHCYRGIMFPLLHGKMQIIYVYMPIITVQIPASCASVGLPSDGDVLSRLIEKLGLIEVGNVACSCSRLTPSGGRLHVIKLYYISVQETLLNGHFTYFTEQDDREQKESDGGGNEAFPASLIEYRTIISLRA